MSVAEAVLRKDGSRFSAVELFILIAMVAVVVGFIIVKFSKGGGAVSRASIAQDFANHLQKAREDSIKRQPSDIKQMAQVKVFNRQFYSVAIDADGDGQLDIPLVMTFSDQGVEIAGPFPRTFIFDKSGQTVDAKNQPSPSQAVILRDSDGATAIKLSPAGQATVVPAVKTN